MEKERKVVTVGKMSTELIVGFFIYGIVYGIIYYLLFNFLMYVLQIESIIVTSTISAVFQGIFAFLIWKWNISSTFKRRTITKNKVPAIMRNLYIFTIILCIVSSILSFRKINMSLDYTIDTELKLGAIYINSSDYQEQKDSITKKVKSELYKYFAIIEIEYTIAYLGVVPLQKKKILENSIDEEI